MNTRRFVTVPPPLRWIPRLLAALLVLAALGALTAATAHASSHKSSKPKSESTSASKSTAKVDLNTASLKELETLPGIGTVMGQKIMAGRPYKKVSDLREAGIPQSTIDGLKGHVTVSHPASSSSSTASKTEGKHKGKASHGSEAGHATVSAESEHGKQTGHGTEAKPSEPPAAKSGEKHKTFLGIPMGGGESKPASTEHAGGHTATAPAKSTAVPAPAPVERVEAPAKGMVWVNLDSKVYHYEGDHWYGATKHGKFMWEDQAIRDGYRAAKKGGKPEAS
jgi:hypothetical protein